MRALTVSAIVLTSLLGLSVTMCSSSGGGGDASTSPLANGQHFRGVLVGSDGSTGVFELAETTTSAPTSVRLLADSAVPIHGQVALGTGVTANLTGTYDPATGRLAASGTGSVSGVPFQFDATFANGRLSGTYTALGVTGNLEGFAGLASSISLYCGNFVGAKQGGFNFAKFSNLAAGVATFTGTSPIVLGGTANGTTLAMTYANGGQLDGTVEATSASGTWTDASGNGTFSATSGACPTVSVGTGVINPPGADGGGLPPAGDGGTPQGDGGTIVPGTEAEIATSTDFVDFVAESGDYVAYAGLEGTALSFVKKDGTGKQDIASVCVPNCKGVVAQGAKFTVWDSTGNVKQITPPSTTVTTLPGTLSTSPTFGVANDRYVWFTPAVGGIQRYDTTAQNSANYPSGETIGGISVFGDYLYYVSQSNPTYVLRKFNGAFTEEANNLSFYSQITPDDLGIAVNVDAAGYFYLSTKKTGATDVKLWTVEATAELPTKLVSTLDLSTKRYRPLLDATKVYLADGVDGGRLVSVTRATRNGAGATLVKAFPSGVAAFVKDQTAFYVASGKTVVRVPVPN